MAKRALATHPLVKKLERIFQIMEDEKVYIYWNGDCFIVIGEDKVEWELRDIEDDDGFFGASAIDLPPKFEYKLVRD